MMYAPTMTLACRSLTRLGLPVLALALLGGCATAPETGRSQLLLISPAQEAEMGFQSFSKIKQQKSAVASGKDAEMVRTVGARIARVAPVPGAKWEFVLFNDKTPNAFALPGGKVGVNTGILPITQNEAGLATVISHEIAHVTAHHGAERMSQSMAVDLGGQILSAALGSQGGGGLAGDAAVAAYGLGTQVGVLLPYSRVHESEADEIGLMYMARAGFDPREAIGFWQRFAAYNAKQGGSKGPAFLSTHPLDERRIALLQAAMPRALAEYQKTQVARR